MSLQVSVRHAFAAPRDNGHQATGFGLDIAFTGPVPGVTVLFGPSGCGKSTTLAAVAGLLRPDSGQVLLEGTPLLDTARRLVLPPEARRCGVVFQDSRLFPHMSVASNLRYGLRRAPQQAVGPGFAEVVELLGLGALLTRRPAGLSGGEKQRVALGRALLSRPRLLLMDEPLAALDAPRRAEVLPFLERLRGGALRLPILYVTHALDEVDRLADHLVLLERGRVVAAGSVEELSARTDLPQLAGRQDAGAVLPCRVATHDAARGITQLEFAGGMLEVPLRAEAPGTALRLRMRARDVAVAIQPPQGISIHNTLPATIAALTPLGAHEVYVSLAVGQAMLLARITRDAVAQLGLAPGMAAWALIKSVTLDQQ